MEKETKSDIAKWPVFLTRPPHNAMSSHVAVVMPERPTMWLEGWNFDVCAISLTFWEGQIKKLEAELNNVIKDSISHAVKLQ